MAKHYYRCESTSEIGKRLRKLLNDCQKAERAQMDFGKKCGAESIVPVDQNFEGGVVGVVFGDETQVNKTVWTAIVKDKDGKTIWRPNCNRREGVVVTKDDKYRPSNTATRVYDYKHRSYAEVKHLVTMPEEQAKDKKFIRYVELYRKDTDKPVREMSKLQREAINLEHRRLMLPVVTPLRVFRLLQADMMDGTKEGERMNIVKPETPTFWEYGNHWYVGCSFPCKAEGLQEISSETYVSKRTDLLRVQRDMEVLAKSDPN